MRSREEVFALPPSVPIGSWFPEIFPEDRIDVLVDPALDTFKKVIEDLVGNKQYLFDTFKSKVEYPKTDIYLSKRNYLVFEMAVPGLSKEEISVEYDEKKLTISSVKPGDEWKDDEGETDSDLLEEMNSYIGSRGKKFIIRELKRSSFIRKWNLTRYPIKITDENPIISELKNGILKIELPLQTSETNQTTKTKIEIN